jgi:hypothetical protein
MKKQSLLGRCILYAAVYNLVQVFQVFIIKKPSESFYHVKIFGNLSTFRESIYHEITIIVCYMHLERYMPLPFYAPLDFLLVTCGHAHSD